MCRKWLFFSLAVLTALMVITADPVYARPKQEITVLSEIMFGPSEEYVPEIIHEEGGQLYRLKSWELEPVIVNPREKYVTLKKNFSNQKMTLL